MWFGCQKVVWNQKFKKKKKIKFQFSLTSNFQTHSCKTFFDNLKKLTILLLKRCWVKMKLQVKMKIREEKLL